MRPILLVRNEASETFGVAPRALHEAGVQTLVWEAIDGDAPPALEEVSGVVVFGSTFNVEHAGEQPFIERAATLARGCVERGVPVLGLCFGAQLLAWGLGARVGKADVREVGFEPIAPTDAAASDDLLPHYGAGDRVFQWHMDTFDLPQGATLLATSDNVSHQAFRVGAAAWGVQFHLEIDGAELELWLDGYEEEGNLERDWGKTPDEVRAEAARTLAEHEAKGAEVFRRFARVARNMEAARTETSPTPY